MTAPPWMTKRIARPKDCSKRLERSSRTEVRKVRLSKTSLCSCMLGFCGEGCVRKVNEGVGFMGKGSNMTGVGPPEDAHKPTRDVHRTALDKEAMTTTCHNPGLGSLSPANDRRGCHQRASCQGDRETGENSGEKHREGRAEMARCSFRTTESSSHSFTMTTTSKTFHPPTCLQAGRSATGHRACSVIAWPKLGPSSASC